MLEKREERGEEEKTKENKMTIGKIREQMITLGKLEKNYTRRKDQ